MIVVAAINPEEHLGLVYKVVLKYAPKGVKIEDTEEYSDGVLALLEACDKYNPKKHKTKFSTFAFSCIKNAMHQKWRKENSKKRTAVMCPLKDVPDKNSNLESVKSLLEDHPKDTVADRKNKKILFDHFFNGLTWEEIGAQMRKYGHQKPVSKARAQQCGLAAIDLIRKRLEI